jgi:dihydrofolate reductase
MRISIIAAVAQNGVIGRGGKLPWHLSDDLRRFKQLTMGHMIVMGRRTWESINRPLPGRRMVVVSRQTDYHVDVPNIEVATSLDEALRIAEAAGDNEAFIIGGGELYRQALPRADRLYLTLVLANVDGDTYFHPEIDWNAWVIVRSEHHEADSQNDYPHDFTILQRCEPKQSTS